MTEAMNKDQQSNNINLEAKDIMSLDLSNDAFNTSSFWKSRDETQQHYLEQKLNK